MSRVIPATGGRRPATFTSARIALMITACATVFALGTGTAFATMNALTLNAPTVTTVNSSATYGASISLAQALTGTGDTLNSLVFTVPENTTLPPLVAGSFTVSKGSVSSVTSVDNGTTRTMTVNLTGATGGFGLSRTTFTMSFAAGNPSVAGSYGGASWFQVVANGTGGPLTVNRTYALTGYATAPTAGTPTLTDTTEWASATMNVPVTVGATGRLAADAVPNSVTTPNKITVTFPAGYTVPAAPTAASVTIGGTPLTTAPTVVGNAVTMNIPTGVTVANSGSTTVAFLPAFGMPNPDAGTYTVTASTDIQTGVDTSESYTVTAAPTTLSVVSANQPAAATVIQGQTLAVGGFTLQRNASSNSVALSTITVDNAGTSPASTVAGVDVYRDNGDGSCGAGDTKLNSAVGVFVGTSSLVTFTSAENVTTSAQQYWIVYDFSGTAADAATASARVSSAAHTANSLSNTSAAGSSFVVDSAPPTVTITAPASNGALLGGVTPPYVVTGVADDTVSGVASLLLEIQRTSDSSYWNGLTWQSGQASVVPVLAGGGWTYSWNLPVVQDGTESYTFRAFATDDAGLSSQADRTAVVFDNVEPATTETVAPAGPNGANGWYTSAPSVTLSRDEAGETFYKWDAAPSVGDQTAYVGALTPAQGTHTLHYYSVDSAGNAETVGTGTTIKLDSIAPTTPSATAVATYRDTVEVSFSGATDSGSGVDVFTVFDSGTPVATSGTSPVSLTVAPGSSHSYTVQAVDAAGNASSASDPSDIVMDATPPVTTASAVPAAPNGSAGWYTTAPAVTLTSSDPGTTFYRWDAGGWSTYGSAVTAGQGTHTLTYYSVDSLGNTEAVGAGSTFKVDSSAPSAPTATATTPTNTSIQVSWSGAADGGSGIVSYSVYEGAGVVATTAGSSATISVAAGSTHTYTVKATDEAGNVSNASDPVTATTTGADTTPPITSASAVPSSPDGLASWYVTVPAVTLTSNEPGTTFYRWDSGGWSTYGSAVTAGQGTHTLTYYSVDANSNTEAVGTGSTFKVDSIAPTAPTATATAPTSTSIQVSWSGATDAGSGITSYRVYEGAGLVATTAGSPATISVVAGTTHTYTVKAVDAAGNVSGASNAVSATTPGIAPVTALTAAPAVADGPSGWYTSAPSVTLTPDIAATTQYRWDGSGPGGFAAYGGALTPAEGTHTLNYFSFSSNATETVKTRTFKLDTQAPSVPGGVGTSGVTPSSATVSWSASTDSASGVAQYDVVNADTDAVVSTVTGTSAAISGLSPSTTYHFAVVARDVVGHESARSSAVDAVTQAAVVVNPGDDVTGTQGGIRVIFTRILTAGVLGITPYASDPHPAPPGFRFLSANNYDISTTSTHEGVITVIMPYNPASAGADESQLRIFHWEGGSWVDVTDAVDTGANEITGHTDGSLSPFGVGAPMAGGGAVTPASSPWSIALLLIAGLGIASLEAARRRRTSSPGRSE